jgi:CBS domain containing-hemolysin-like protein
VNLFAVASVPPENRGATIAGYVRPPLLIPESAPVGDILPRLRRSRQPMCLVVNERSEVTGLLTVEDILEEIVGQQQPAPPRPAAAAAAARERPPRQ